MIAYRRKVRSPAWLYLILGTWGALAALPAWSDPQPYSMRGVQLGITLDEFKAFPMPLEQLEAAPRVACSPEDSDLYLDPADVRAGVMDCEWRVQHELPPSSYNFPPTEGPGYIDLGDGNAGARPKFEFIRDDAGVYRLFRIELETGSVVWNDIYPAYEQAFGPGAEVEGTVQNAFGAIFSDKSNDWSNAVSSIKISQRCNGTVDRMCITYTHSALFARYIQLRKAAEGPPLL